MINPPKNSTYSRLEIFLRAVVFVAAIIASYFILRFALPLLYPFLIGWLIAMSIEPVVCFLKRRAKMPRWLGVLICLLILISTLITALGFIIAEIISELAQFSKMLPSLVEQGQDLFINFFTEENSNISRIIDTVQQFLANNPDSQQQISTTIQNNLGFIATEGTVYIKTILQAIARLLGNLPSLLAVLAFITLSAFFIGIDWPNLRERLYRIIPNNLTSTSASVVSDIKSASRGFIRAQLTLISISAITIFTGLVILKVPYALTLSLLFGIIELIPYVGIGACFIPWISYLFIVNESSLAFGLLALFATVIIVRQIVEPKIVATHVGINPLATLVAIFAGVELFGVLGLILGPAVVVVLLSLYRANVFKDIHRFIFGPKSV